MMSDKTCRAVLAAILSALLAGCALYPAVQVAGGAMTGYDAARLADEYMPRDKVEGGSVDVIPDSQMQRRLRERLALNDIHLSAHVIDAKAYLIGQVSDRNQADYAVRTAATVEGLKSITCKFYPQARPDDAARDAANDALLLREVTGRFGKTRRLHGADLRVEVVSAHAILVGRARDYGQKTAALAIAAETSGVADVVDYITVPEPPDDGAVASN
jgi:osmotically-inducible protein OsmY